MNGFASNSLVIKPDHEEVGGKETNPKDDDKSKHRNCYFSSRLHLQRKMKN